MNILLTNDDGYFAPGITILKEELQKSHTVTLVAPDRERSATGHSVTLNSPLTLKKIDDCVYSVSGTPTDSTKIALLQIFKDKKPDLIISGINQGGNIGEDITYSGTVANAIEGTLYSIPSIAVSLNIKNFFTQVQKKDEKLYFDSAAKFISKFIKNFDFNNYPQKTFFNINVPNIPYEEIKGFEFTSLGRRCYGEDIVEQITPHGKPIFWFIGTRCKLFDDEGSDSQAVLNNKISITPLHLDFTNYSFLNKLKNNFEMSLWK